jgi:hypothetical protein
MSVKSALARAFVATKLSAQFKAINSAFQQTFRPTDRPAFEATLWTAF